MNQERRIFTPDEIYRKLIAALVDKSPLPPEGWRASKLDEEVWRAGPGFESDAFLRQRDALDTCLVYLVDYALRMPERVNLSTSNSRAREMCEELADEIVKITFEPGEVIKKHGKLKLRLNAILAVQTCLIYREETTRYIAELDEAKRAARRSPSKNDSLMGAPVKEDKWQSALAKNIFQNAFGKSPGRSTEKSSEQPSLF